VLASITWPVSFLSRLVGTYSHIGLDAIMHGDMNPLWPLAAGNGMLGVVSLGSLHMLCLMSGVIGVLIIAGKAYFFGTKL
jgi:membrane-bound metal-dependent hydrolase YbcI (DUF457 family)